MCVYIYECICMSIYIYPYVFRGRRNGFNRRGAEASRRLIIHIYVYIYTYIYTHNIHVCVYMNVYVCIYIYIHMCFAADGSDLIAEVLRPAVA